MMAARVHPGRVSAAAAVARIDALAYIVAESTDPSRWKTFGEDVVGLMAREAPDGGLYLKMDERNFRIAVVRGGEDRYHASGWEVADEDAFAAVVLALERAGTEVRMGDQQLCRARCAQQVASFRDPSGNRHELVWGYTSDFARFVSPAGVPGFVTGTCGMGHTVLPAPRFDETWTFFRDVLGFGLADLYRHRYTDDPAEPVKRIHFTHCANPRHHSLALYEAEVPSGCVHMMIEVPTMDEVGRAYDRMRKHDVKLMATLGRHVNDEVVSFYMSTPSNFALEFGYGGRLVDWSRHRVFETTAVSLWGHDFSVGFR
jgi:3,4-dihydroxy-9,10-secoandrosta-1,3,5(10)-triene-9,17-dione 4,5-dioxygenase